MVVVVDVAPQLAAEHDLGVKPRSVNEFRLQRVKEGLDVCVLLRPATSRALLDPERPQPLPQRHGGVFTPPITVKDHAGRWLPTADRRVKHALRQVRISSARQAPREDPTRPLIHHHGEKPPLPAHRKVGEIAHPHLIGALCPTAREPIRMLSKEAMQRRIAPIDPRHPRAQSRRAHQSLDAAAAHAPSLGLELAMNARAPVAPTVTMKDRGDALC